MSNDFVLIRIAKEKGNKGLVKPEITTLLSKIQSFRLS